MSFNDVIAHEEETNSSNSSNHIGLNIPRKSYRQDIPEVFQALSVIDRATRDQRRASWTEPQEYILDTWAISAANYKWMHIKAYRYYLFLNDVLTIPIIILSSTSALGGVAIVTNDAPTKMDFIVSYLLAIANMAVAILSSLQRYKKYAEIAEQHHVTAIEFSKFYREIKLELVLDPNERAHATDFAKGMKEEYDKLLSKSPEIPGHIAKKLDDIKDSHLSPSFIRMNASIPFCM